jgi:uncharacterized protein YjbI with pentapeptide repeats
LSDGPPRSNALSPPLEQKDTPRLCHVWAPLTRLSVISGWPAAARRRVARGSLFTSVTFAIVTGAAIAISVSFAIGIALHTKVGAGSPAPIDVLKTALTVVAGIGGAVALVVAYRRQRDLEQGRFVERFGAAAAQLGDADVAVRIAGVYAMAGVADESRDFARRQQCIDVLCGYLRLGYDPDHGASHLAKLVVTSPATSRFRRWRPNAGRPGSSGDQGSLEKHYEYRQQDREVRQTIVRTIAAHVRADVDSWSQYHFDFRDAVLEGVDLNGALFSEEVSFQGASFLLQTTFEGTRFSRSTFEKAKFSGDTSFSRSDFFNAADFSNTLFDADARFDQVKFRGGAYFVEAEFKGRWTTFCDTTFNKWAEFGFAKFGERASFNGGTKFKCVARFFGVEFEEASFGDAAVNVGHTEFVDGPTTFEQSAWFQGARFAKAADFYRTIFSGEAAFDSHTIISRRETEGGPKFLSGGRFDQATFKGGGSFVGADFGEKDVSFREPVEWSDSLKFDWDEDVSRKPANVKPDIWPPVVHAK